MSRENIEKHFADLCDTLLKNQDIRYLCLVDKMGTLISEKIQKEKEHFFSDQNTKELYMKKKLEMLLIKDFDDDLGKLEYVVATREKIRILTIPFYGFLIIVTVEKDTNCDLIAHSIIKLLEN